MSRLMETSGGYDSSCKTTYGSLGGGRWWRFWFGGVGWGGVGVGWGGDLEEDLYFIDSKNDDDLLVEDRVFKGVGEIDNEVDDSEYPCFEELLSDYVFDDEVDF
ncbi:Uncharacterized protein Adt_24088 [Abeliophyllum distichum]|uniref:Uncharacterized protein n=1 Tax=Abeliophyllum distichum TaxID=126358 RepID=A0ABD1SDS0_9LAMI